MKTKAFLLLCLTLGIGSTQLPAQDGDKNLYHTYVHKYHNVPGFFPVTCDGVNFYILDCICDVTETVHCAKDIPWWWKGEVNWTATNTSTGEIFKGRELDKLEILNVDPVTFMWLEITGTWRGIISGDMGSRYHITLSVTITPDSFTWSLVEAKCF